MEVLETGLQTEDLFDLLLEGVAVPVGAVGEDEYENIILRVTCRQNLESAVVAGVVDDGLRRVRCRLDKPTVTVPGVRAVLVV